MNTIEYDIMNILLTNSYENQRVLAKKCNYSLGMINRSLKHLMEEDYLDEKMNLTQKAVETFAHKKPKNAIILAAGFGMRMVPINTETPKAFLEIDGEPLIERTIRQLHEAGITKIYIVVGFMKEQFEYLIDEYGVELIVNPDYATKNNLHSMKLAAEHLSDTYVIPCDIWCGFNPYRERELYSWYMVSNLVDNESTVRVNRKMELVEIPKYQGGNSMVGISYISAEDAKEIKDRIYELDKEPCNENEFWEKALCRENKMVLTARVVSSQDIVEIDTYEQLRELDDQSAQLKTDAITIAADALHATEEDICEITVLKKGMTNRSFLFSCKDKKYIMRIPGEGTEQLINRAEEASVYETIRDKNICDNIIYINPKTGYKITEYLEGARVCDAFNPEDVQKCMDRLRGFHQLKLKVDHEFDIFGKTNFYETLWEGKPSVYRDYEKTKEHVFSLKTFIEKHVSEKILTHIDAVPDNFLFVKDKDGKEEIRLIDWEYAAMQDPHVDLAMFCIYALYDKDQVEQLIDAYFKEGCDRKTRVKIYCYIAACGLLWSNWCEYKRNLGVEFGEYSLRQYRYAKDYYKIAIEGIKELGENDCE